MKKLKSLLCIITLLVMFLSSCSTDNSQNSNKLTVSAKATYTNSAGRLSDGTINSSVIEITSFKINIKEIEFKLAELEDSDDDDNDNDGDDDNDGYFDFDDEIGLQGPWELDLLNQTNPLTTVSIANGTYEEVEFKLNKSTVTTSQLYNKTIEIRGLIDGVPFIFTHDFEKEFSIDYEDNNQSLIINNNSYDLVLNFDLNQWLSTIDLSTAVDGNGDGTIEISPNDPDGNNNLANQLNEDLEGSCEIDD